MEPYCKNCNIRLKYSEIDICKSCEIEEETPYTIVDRAGNILFRYAEKDMAIVALFDVKNSRIEKNGEPI